MEAVRRTRLRVGIFADSARQPRWVVEALAKVAASDDAEIAVIAIPESPARESASPPALWRAYAGLDRKLFGGPMNWSEEKDITALVPAERRIALPEGDCLRTWRARMVDVRLDVAFALGGIEDRCLEGLARYGAWRYCFGDEQGVSVPLAGVREAIDAAPVTASGIRIRLGAGKPDRIASPSWSRTFPFSVARSRDAIFAKTAEFAARSLRDLHTFGPRWLEEGTVAARPLPAQGFPSTSGLIHDISTLGMRVARRAVEKALSVEQWSIAFRFSPEEEWNGSLEGFFRLEPPKDRFWADPFPITVNGRHYIFFEEQEFAASKAHISVIEVDRAGRASAPTRVLVRDYHLSYPFLIEEEGNLYMIPETAHNNTVEIYRCVDFPARWRLEKVLLRDVFCADATLHRAQDRWWMFANAASPGAEINDELHLYSSDRLLGEWKPHPRNPIKSDVRSARPAGRLFWRGERLFRPGQICAPLYGSGIALHHVTRLTQDDYAEEEDGRIMPASGSVLGIHTINRAGDLSVTDAFMRRPRFSAP